MYACTLWGFGFVLNCIRNRICSESRQKAWSTRKEKPEPTNVFHLQQHKTKPEIDKLLNVATINIKISLIAATVYTIDVWFYALKLIETRVNRHTNEWFIFKWCNKINQLPKNNTLHRCIVAGFLLFILFLCFQIKNVQVYCFLFCFILMLSIWVEKSNENE